MPIITSERYEADDVIGTLTTKAAAAGFDVAIVTGDKDFFQLVRDGIRVFNPRDEGTWYDAAGVKEKFGVAPDQVVDVLALMGDTIDNIKGVPGIGEKGARELISTYGTLENSSRTPPKCHRTKLSRRRCSRTPTRRARAASWRGSAPTCRWPFDADAPSIPRPVARALLRALQRARLPDARRRSTRRPPTRSTKTYRARHHGRRSCASSPRELRAAGRFALSVLADQPSAMRAVDRRPRVLDRRRARRGYVPVGHRRASAQTRNVPLGRCARRAEAAARGCRDRARSATT